MSVGSFIVKRGVLFVPKEDSMGLKSYKNFYISIIVFSIFLLPLFIDGEFFLAFTFTIILYLISFVIFFPKVFVNLKTFFINEDGIEYESHSSKPNRYGIQNKDTIFDYDSEINFYKPKWKDINLIEISKSVVAYQITIHTNKKIHKFVTYNWHLGENQESKLSKYGIFVANEMNEKNILQIMIDTIKYFHPNINIVDNSGS